MALNPAPIQEPIVGPNGRITQVWVRWFLNLVSQIQSGGGGGAAVWGTITGTLSSQTDLQSALNAKAALAHTHAASDIVSGTISTARLGSGTADATTYLRGDNTWASVVGTAAWGSITGTLSSQSDLQGELDAKQDDLISGTNIKTINGNSVMGSGDLVVGVAINEAVLDFGTGSYNAMVAVADASVTAATKVMASLTGVQGRDADELEMSPIMLGVAVIPSVGFEIYGNALQKADGQFNVHYTKA